jgi:hypothetical protein
MRGVIWTGLLVVGWVAPLGAQEAPPGGGAAKPAQESYTALVKEYQDAMQAFSQAYQKAKTSEEQAKVVQEQYPRPEKYAARMLAIAEVDPKSPAAVEPLVWLLQNASQSAEGAKAIQLLAAHHADSPKLGNAVANLVYTMSPAGETLLRAVLEKGANREMRGSACLALAQYLKQRADYVRMMQEQNDQAGQVEAAFLQGGMTKEELAALKAKGPDPLLTQAEALFERAAKEFGDVKAGRGTIEKVAGGELHELRDLGVGKPCPEIEGKDIDGVAFKLSDYRGKVVVVDFWGDW